MTVKPIEQSGGSSAGALVLGLIVVGGLVAAAVFVVQALPALHDPLPIRAGHYVTPKRVTQADRARAIIKDPRSDCDFFECNTSSTLRVCEGNVNGLVTWAMQWVTCIQDAWCEGTSFLQKQPHKRDNYMRNNGCPAWDERKRR